MSNIDEKVKEFFEFDFKSLAGALYSLSPMEFSTLGCLLGLLIASPLTLNEQNSIGNFLELVGQVILTVNAQGTTLAPSSPTTEQFNIFKQETISNFEILFKNLNK